MKRERPDKRRREGVGRSSLPKRLGLTAGVILAMALLTAAVFLGEAAAAKQRGTPSGKNTASATSPPAFDGGRAFQDLKRLVSFGPRPAGSEALDRARRWMEGELTRGGVQVEEDPFTASTPAGNLHMVNLIARLPGSSPEILMVSGHYDTKRFDRFRFVGANDGGSSAALVMELARALDHRPSRYTLWLVWFDGEEAVREQWSDADSTYGSRHLEERMSSSGELNRIQAMILVDMVGDAQLDIKRDTNSTPWLSDLVFRTAHRLGYSRYFLDQPYPVGGDDHFPFINAGVPAVDIIDFDYGPQNSYWHTAQDTVEQCSAQSLGIVGSVVLAAVEELESSPHIPPGGSGK
jgi:glutaminyl-peptide cyclotransferase